MKILSIECSAVPCSVAILEDDKLIASSFTNVKLTHSETLMPMVEATLSSAKLTIGDIDTFAVSEGPGSFTGIRIGISAIKGMAQPFNKSCVGVSTLLAMAYNYIDSNALICSVMDARCNQVYNALFKINDGKIERLCEDRALLFDELKADLEKYSDQKIIIVGDGAEIFYNTVAEQKNIQLSAITNRYQNAVGVAYGAIEMINAGNIKSYQELLPVYLRLPQAERELKLKKENLK